MPKRAELARFCGNQQFATVPDSDDAHDILIGFADELPGF
jgi:hypothetical protein